MPVAGGAGEQRLDRRPPRDRPACTRSVCPTLPALVARKVIRPGRGADPLRADQEVVERHVHAPVARTRGRRVVGAARAGRRGERDRERGGDESGVRGAWSRGIVPYAVRRSCAAPATHAPRRAAVRRCRGAGRLRHARASSWPRATRTTRARSSSPSTARAATRSPWPAREGSATNVGDARVQGRPELRSAQGDGRGRPLRDRERRLLVGPDAAEHRHRRGRAEGRRLRRQVLGRRGRPAAEPARAPAVAGRCST